MAEKLIYKTLRAKWETAEDYRKGGKTAEASDLNQLTIAETLIEILAALEEIADSLNPPAASEKPVKLAANPKSSTGNPKS